MCLHFFICKHKKKKNANQKLIKYYLNDFFYIIFFEIHFYKKMQNSHCKGMSWAHKRIFGEVKRKISIHWENWRTNIVQWFKVFSMKKQNFFGWNFRRLKAKTDKIRGNKNITKPKISNSKSSFSCFLRWVQNDNTLHCATKNW